MTTKEYYIAYFCSKDRKHWHYEKMFCSYDECENKCKEKIAGKDYKKYLVEHGYPKNYKIYIILIFFMVKYIKKFRKGNYYV